MRPSIGRAADNHGIRTDSVDGLGGGGALGPWPHDYFDSISAGILLPLRYAVSGTVSREQDSCPCATLRTVWPS